MKSPESTDKASAQEDRAARRERLMERLFQGTSGELKDADLLELLLAYATPRRDVRGLTEELLRRFGTLQSVLDASTVELRFVPGLADHGAGMLKLVRELLFRVAEPPGLCREILEHPRQMERYLLSRLGGVKDESLLLIFLDNQGVVLGEEVLGAGTVDQVVAFPRQVMQVALRHNATALLVVHNHPHGPPLPSVADREEAEGLRDVLRPFDITVKDCIVVGQNRCFSIFNNAPL